jgi:lysophospholipase L1-like esterase
MSRLSTLSPVQMLGGDDTSTSALDPDVVRGRLRRYFTEVGNRSGGPLDVLFLGDSITEGARTESTGVGNRFSDVLVSALRARFQPSGVVGGYYIPAWAMYATLLPTTWAFTGTTTNNSAEGLGYYNTVLSSAATATLTFTGTGVRVFYSALAGASTATVTIDGGAVASINAATGAPNYGAYVDYTGLSAGPHTLVITNGTGSLSLQGAYYFHGDETSGVRMWNGGHSGFGVGNFPNFTSASINPHLAVIAFGTNDYRLAYDDPATVQSKLIQLIQGIQAATSPKPSVVLMAMPESTLGASVTPLASWPLYVAAISAAATATGALFVDLEPLFADSGIPDPAIGAIYTDAGPAYVHPTNAGHKLIGDFLAELLVPPTKSPAEQLFVSASQFVSSLGGPNILVRGNALVVWELDSASQEAVTCNVVMPPDWRTVSVDFLWTNDNTGTGNVRWRCDMSAIPDNAGVASGPTAQVVATAGVQYAKVKTSMLSAVAVQPGCLHRIFASRLGADATDTLPNDAGLIGVVIRRIS